MEVLLESVFILALILANGALAMSEMAMVAARKPRLQQMANDGSHGAAAALKLTEEPGAFLSAVQIGITLVGILIGVFGGVALGKAIAGQLSRIGWLEPYAGAIGVALVVILLTYLTLVLGELVPKQIALRKSEAVAAMIAPPMTLLARGTAPLVVILSASSALVLRILGQGISDEPDVSEEDVRIMLEQGAKSGVFEPMEGELVGQVFRLADLDIGDLITPRREVMWIEESDSIDAIRQKVISSRKSRLPVARGNLDEVTGIVLAKDLLAQSLSGAKLDIAAILQPVLFIPENTAALSLVERFKETHSKIAMVIDEYGGVEGLVTMDDVMEALVGEMPELSEPDIPSAVQRDDGSWLVDGMLLLEDFEETLELDELPESASYYRTVGGLVMGLLGRMPVMEDRVEWAGYVIEVVDMDGRRVDKVLVSEVNQGLAP